MWFLRKHEILRCTQHLFKGVVSLEEIIRRTHKEFVPTIDFDLWKSSSRRKSWQRHHIETTHNIELNFDVARASKFIVQAKWRKIYEHIVPENFLLSPGKRNLRAQNSGPDLHETVSGPVCSIYDKQEKLVTWMNVMDDNAWETDDLK